MARRHAIGVSSWLCAIALAVVSAPPRAQAAKDQNDQDVWEIIVSASRQSHAHRLVTTPIGALTERELKDSESACNYFRIERWHGTQDGDRVTIGTDGTDPDLISSQGSGSAGNHVHYLKRVARDITEQREDQQGSFDASARDASTFTWNSEEKTALFETGASFVGTDRSRDRVFIFDRPKPQVDRTDVSSGVSKLHCGGGGMAGAKSGVTVRQTKFGFVVNWSSGSSTGDKEGGTSSEEAHGSATIRRFVKHEPMELVVSPGDYHSWLPQAGPDQKTPGNQLPVRATLKTKNGKPIPADQVASKIRFELVNVSSEPGICMNYPDSLFTEEAADPDLQFSNAGGMKLSPADHPRTAETPDGQDSLTEASAVISAFDWGAWGSLRVTAQLDDGEMIVGHLDGKPDETEILVPRRNKRSEHVAAYWKETRGVTGGDDDDSEKLAEPPNVGSPESRKGPEADKRPGDGFTLYEEYRGFREKGAHFYGDPMKKDLFVRDRIGGRSKDGVALFEAITGIRVHSQFTDEEFPLDHIVNDNAGAGAHNVDQHGLVLIASEVQGPAVSEGLPGGTPGQHTEIVITESFDPGPNGWQTVRQGRSKITSDVYAVTIAHEMLHGVGVLHHGEIDPGYVLWRKGTDAAGHPVILEGDYQKDAHGKPTPVGGHPVRVMRENGSQMSPDAFVEPKLIWLGGEGGQHSGFENCVMRYDVAQAYERGGDPSLRYYVEEQTGISLCDRKTDLPNGVNGASHKPWPRYGNADEGDCFHQIKVRDD